MNKQIFDCLHSIRGAERIAVSIQGACLLSSFAGTAYSIYLSLPRYCADQFGVGVTDYLKTDQCLQTPGVDLQTTGPQMRWFANKGAKSNDIPRGITEPPITVRICPQTTGDGLQITACGCPVVCKSTPVTDRCLQTTVGDCPVVCKPPAVTVWLFANHRR
jgi:hypothetical protein